MEELYRNRNLRSGIVASVLSLGLLAACATQPEASSLEVSVGAPTTITADCSNENLDARTAFLSGKAYFDRAEKEYSAQDYQNAVDCFNVVIQFPAGEDFWRKAYYYSARALLYGVEDKQIDEASNRFHYVLREGINDKMTEFSLYALWKITFTTDSEQGIFDSKRAETFLDKLREKFPNGWQLKVIEEELRTFRGPED